MAARDQTISPGAAPRVLGEGREFGLFAMQYRAPERYPGDSAAKPEFANQVGATLARTPTAGDAAVGVRCANDETFHAIPLERYLVATGRTHPELGAAERVAPTHHSQQAFSGAW